MKSIVISSNMNNESSTPLAYVSTKFVVFALTNNNKTLFYFQHFVIGTSRFIFLIFIITCSIILMNLTQGNNDGTLKSFTKHSKSIR